MAFNMWTSQEASVKDDRLSDGLRNLPDSCLRNLHDLLLLHDGSGNARAYQREDRPVLRNLHDNSVDDAIMSRWPIFDIIMILSLSMAAPKMRVC